VYAQRMYIAATLSMHPQLVTSNCKARHVPHSTQQMACAYRFTWYVTQG